MLRIERNYAWFLGLVAGAIAGLVLPFCLTRPPIPAEAASSLFSAVISVAAIAVGFLITVKSILFTIDDKPIIKTLKRTYAYEQLMKYIIGATYWSFLLSGISVFMLFLDLKCPGPLNWVSFAIWTSFVVGGAASCFRVIRVFGKIMTASDQNGRAAP